MVQKHIATWSLGGDSNVIIMRIDLFQIVNKISSGYTKCNTIFIFKHELLHFVWVTQWISHLGIMKLSHHLSVYICLIFLQYIVRVREFPHSRCICFLKLLLKRILALGTSLVKLYLEEHKQKNWSTTYLTFWHTTSGVDHAM